MSLASDVARMLLEKDAIQVSTDPYFVWTSGIKSPIYCDNRLLISYPNERRQIIEGFIQIVEEQKLDFDVIGGTATAGIPWAAFLAYELKKPMIYIRPKPKGYGAGKQVEGRANKGAKVLIIEDLISTGGSSIGSAEACRREFEADITAILAIFTYQFKKASDAFQQAKIPLFTLSDYSALMGTLKGKFTERNLELIATFSHDPENWNNH